MSALRKLEEPAKPDRADEAVVLLEIAEHMPKQDADHNLIEAQVKNALGVIQGTLASNPTQAELQKFAGAAELSTVIPEKRRKLLAWLLRRVSAGELSIAVGAITIKSIIDAVNQDAVERMLRSAVDQLDGPLDMIRAAIRGEKED